MAGNILLPPFQMVRMHSKCENMIMIAILIRQTEAILCRLLGKHFRIALQFPTTAHKCVNAAPLNLDYRTLFKSIHLLTHRQ